MVLVVAPEKLIEVTGGVMESASAGKATSVSKRTASAVACLTAVFPFDIQRFQLLLLVRGGGHGPFVVVGVLWRHAPHRPLNGSGRCPRRLGCCKHFRGASTQRFPSQAHGWGERGGVLAGDMAANAPALDSWLICLAAEQFARFHATCRQLALNFYAGLSVPLPSPIIV